MTNHKDKQYFTALTDTVDQIIKKQGLKDVDATTGATTPVGANNASWVEGLAHDANTGVFYGGDRETGGYHQSGQ